MDLFRIKSLLEKMVFNESAWNITELFRLRSLNQLDSADIVGLADNSLSELLNLADQFSPKDIKKLVKQWMVKSDEFGIVLVYLGPEKLNHCIPELMEYLQDMNWPAAGYVAHVLRLMSHELLVPELVRIIKADYQDDVWVYGLCSALIDGMDRRFLEILKYPILNYIKNCSYPEEPIRAAETIIPVLTTEEFQEICHYHETKFISYYPLAEMAEFKESFINSHRKEEGA
jgi:hypothetical protein